MRRVLFIRLQSETTRLDAVVVVSSFDQPSITSNLQALTSSKEPNPETRIEGNSLLKVVYSSDSRKGEYKSGIWMVWIQNNNNYNSLGVYFLQPLIDDLPNGLRQLWYMPVHNIHQCTLTPKWKHHHARDFWCRLAGHTDTQRKVLINQPQFLCAVKITLIPLLDLDSHDCCHSHWTLYMK